MKKSKSSNKAKDKLDTAKSKSKGKEVKSNQPQESDKSSSNLMQGMSLELDKMQLNSTET